MATEFMDLASSLFAAIFVLTLLFLLNAVHGLKLLKGNSNIGEMKTSDSYLQTPGFHGKICANAY